MKPLLLNLATAASALLCVAFLSLWTSSYYRGQFLIAGRVYTSPGPQTRLDYGNGSQHVYLTCFAGVTQLDWSPSPRNAGWISPWFANHAVIPPEPALSAPPARHILGFAVATDTALRFVQFPLWFPTLASAILPVLWLRRRKRRHSAGFPISAQPSHAHPDPTTSSEPHAVPRI